MKTNIMLLAEALLNSQLFTHKERHTIANHCRFISMDYSIGNIIKFCEENKIHLSAIDLNILIANHADKLSNRVEEVI